MAEITTTQAFSDGDTVTATKLNNITANAAIQTEAITNRSAETTTDQANDLLLMYDASATALKKVSLSNVIKAGTASNFPVSGSIELGHASDTTLSRGSAGRLQVEGVDVVTATSTDTLTNKTLTSPTINTGTISGGTINNAVIGGTTAAAGSFTTLSATSPITTQAGTAAAPAIVPTGDTNTGIFFPAADTIAFSEGGTESMRIDSSGRVGIGATSLSKKLTVYSDNSTAYSSSDFDSARNLLVQNANTTTNANVGVQFLVGTNSEAAITAIRTGDGTADLAFGTRGGGSRTERLRIDSSGDVIISGNKSLISRGAGGVSTNSAIGEDALQANTTGNNNTANGYAALRSNTTGYNNTANGYAALYSNTTGNNNTANGYTALYSNTTGSYNTANGRTALRSNTTGHNNTANGYAALYSNTTGNSNTAIGVGAGAEGANANTTGSNNIFLGNEAVGTSSTASNVITLGNSAIATLRCQQTSISALSDRRDKKDIVSLASGLSLIQELRPVSFVWDMRSKAKVGQPEIGFIAQELQEAQAKSGLSVPHLVNDDNPEKLEAAPATLIPILVRAVQELSNKVNELEAKLQGA